MVFSYDVVTETECRSHNFDCLLVVFIFLYILNKLDGFLGVFLPLF